MLGSSQSGAGAWGQCQPRPLGSLALGEGHVAGHPHTWDPLLPQPLAPRLGPGVPGAAHSCRIIFTGHLRALLPADRGGQRQGLRCKGHPTSPARHGGHQGEGESGGHTESPQGGGGDTHGDPPELCPCPFSLLPGSLDGFPSPSPQGCMPWVPRSRGFPGGGLPGLCRCRWSGSRSCTAACATGTSSACTGTSPTAATFTCCWSTAAGG